MAWDAEEREGIAKEGSPAVEVSGRRRFSERGEAWPAGGSVSRQARRSGCRPATGSGGGGADRPRGARGGVSLLRRCSHAGESRTNLGRLSAGARRRLKRGRSAGVRGGYGTDTGEWRRRTLASPGGACHGQMAFRQAGR
jgi:hypothetical protein